MHVSNNEFYILKSHSLVGKTKYLHYDIFFGIFVNKMKLFLNN